MRIDLPLCNIKYCRLCHDGNCWDIIKYERCEYTKLKQQFYAYVETNLSPEEITALIADNERLNRLVEAAQKFLWSDTEEEE